MKRANAPASNLSDATRKGFESRAGFSASASSNMEILCANHAQVGKHRCEILPFGSKKNSTNIPLHCYTPEKTSSRSRLFVLRIVFP